MIWLPLTYIRNNAHGLDYINSKVRSESDEAKRHGTSFLIIKA